MHNGKLHHVGIENKNCTAAAVDHEKFKIEVEHIAPQVLSLIIENRSYKVTCTRDGNVLFIHIEGETFKFQIPGDEEDISENKNTKENEQGLLIKSSMPGTVLKIDVKKGDMVEEGQCLIVVEAMKMETSLHATISGKIKNVYVEQGKQINGGDVLIELEEI